MIDIITNWASELVVSLIVVTLIEMLLPENKIKKYVKTVIGIYIIFCIISPFIEKQEFATILEDVENQLKEIKVESQVEPSQNINNTNLEKIYIQEFENEITKKVESLGYVVKKCEVELKIDATKENTSINSIYIKIENEKEENEENLDIQVENVPKVEISINNSKEGNNNPKQQEDHDVQKLKEILSEYYEISKEKITITQN